MPEHPRRRWHWALTLAIPVLTVALLVLAYRVTAPGSRGTPPGGAAAAGDVLRVGALPVT